MNCCLPQVDRHLASLPFSSMHNKVHIDEKWFYVTQMRGCIITVHVEEIEKTSLKSKSCVAKVMFLAVAVSRHHYGRKKFFNGKIGCLPIVESTTAKGSSCNRVKGSKILCPVNVNKEIYKKLLVKKLFPAIREKLPYREGRLVEVKQGNATPHHCWNDPIVQTESRLAIWKIKCINQRSNSPDLNILVLGFFNSIQSLQHKKCANSTQELVEAVLKAFNELPDIILSRNFNTIKLIMNLVLENDGGNKFKIRHLQKSRRQRNGKDVEIVFCTADNIEDAEKFISEALIG